MDLESSQQENSEKIQSQSQSFNASMFAKNNRKNRRKSKKIIHNCCVLIKKSDGSQQMLIRQFFVSCRLKTPKCLAKKAREVQIQKDETIAKELLAQLKRIPHDLQQNGNRQLPQPNNLQNLASEKVSIPTQQTIETHIQFPPIFYILPGSFNFQFI